MRKSAKNDINLNMRLLAIILFPVMFIVTACAHVISQETLKKARTEVAFGTVAANPSYYRGSLFVWGGTIVDTTPTRTGTTIEVIQAPLDRVGSPKNVDISEGRFLVRIKKLLDPLIYTEGRQVTVAGVLIGTEIKPLGETDYEYPVLDAQEIYLWKEEPDYYYPYYPYYPYSYPYYYPGYWGPPWHRYSWCDPFWDPWCRYP